MSKAAPSKTSQSNRPSLVWIGLILLIATTAGIVYWLSGPTGSKRVASDDKQSGPPVAPPDLPRTELSRPPWFRDVTGDSGVAFSSRNGEEVDHFTILESLGSGVALIDYDVDGRLDLFLSGGGYFAGADRKQIKGEPCKLFRNLGDWKFQDVTKEVGLEIAWWYTHGAAVADYDRDGWPDLAVTGYGRVAILHNEAGDSGSRRFVDVTKQLGLRDNMWSTGTGWGDIDGDGYPDLYVCHYADWSFDNHPVCLGQAPGIARDVCPPHRFAPQVHALYHNEKGQKFVDVAAEQGLKMPGYGLGVVLVDINADGRPDVYVANDMSRNFLYVNRKDRLEEKAIFAGVSLDDSGRATASMGVDAGDYDGSGRPALFVTNFQRELPSLYQNLGQESFYYQTWAAGLASLSRSNVGWGTSFIDADNDGWEDLVFVNGHLFRHPVGASVKQQPVLLHNREDQGRRVFQDITPLGGDFFKAPSVARGLAMGDLDNDGWPDLVSNPINSPVVLVRNVAGEASKAQWLGIRLLGKGNRDLVGSTVTVDDGTKKITRFIKGGGSYLSANDSRLLFGIGAATNIKQVKVQWSWGKEQSWNSLDPNHYYECREGEVEAKRVVRPSSN